MVASLPLLVNVAVPQLAMKIAAAQSKTFRDTSVDFIWRSVRSPMLRGLASACQDSKPAAPRVGRVFSTNEEQASVYPDSTANRGDRPPFCNQRPISQRLMPHRDSAT